jgi:cytochrome P450
VNTVRSTSRRTTSGAGLLYCSANRDEAVFTDPGAFDLQRSPNPHLGFGRGGGPHFCLGNQLAKAELRNLFHELLTRLKTVEFGEPDLRYSSLVHGVERLPAFAQ